VRISAGENAAGSIIGEMKAYNASARNDIFGRRRRKRKMVSIEEAMQCISWRKQLKKASWKHRWLRGERRRNGSGNGKRAKISASWNRENRRQRNGWRLSSINRRRRQLSIIVMAGENSWAVGVEKKKSTQRREICVWYYRISEKRGASAAASGWSGLWRQYSNIQADHVG